MKKNNLKILVIGEECTDKFVYCKVNRLSPEAPVPVLIPVKTTKNSGMAGNVVANLKALEPTYITMLMAQTEVITKTRYVEEKSNHMFFRLDEGEETINPIRWSKDFETILKDAQKEVRLDNLDNELSEQVAKQILKEQQIAKKIKERNALENEIKIRNTVEYVLREYPNNPAEGLTAILVGSNLQKVGSRASVALAQLSEYRMLVSGFQEKLRQNNLVELFAEANEDIDRRTARTIWELGEGNWQDD